MKVELMNTIRLDPLKYAESLGFNRNSLLKDLPWLEEAVSKEPEVLATTDPVKILPPPVPVTASPRPLPGTVDPANYYPIVLKNFHFPEGPDWKFGCTLSGQTEREVLIEARK